MYQTGTIAKLNDVLDVLATFLTANGWTVGGNWREPMFTRYTGTIGNAVTYREQWRYGRRIYATKGTLAITAQDFYYTLDTVYGTNTYGGAGATPGPGIAMTIGTAVGGAGGGTDAAHPLSGYNLIGPSHSSNFQGIQDVPGSVSGSARTFIMPLPPCVSHNLGNWNPGMNDMQPLDPSTNFSADATLPAVFGTPGGAARPMTYWLMSDVAGNNIIMVVDRSGIDYDYIATTPYLYFGDMTPTKGGAWTGGRYGGASLGQDATFVVVVNEFIHASRFGPPGTVRDDGSLPMVVRASVDSFVGWLGLGKNQSNSVGTGRSVVSNTLLNPKPTDPNQQVLGILDNGIVGITLSKRRSSMANGAALIPIYWLTQLDNGLWALLGYLPDIFQANTSGIVPGTSDGGSFVYFDGFAVRKHP